MNEHEHPDLLDDELAKNPGPQMRSYDPITDARCPFCRSDKVRYTGNRSLFDWFCTWCDTSF